jgi:hypothetical protein
LVLVCTLFPRPRRVAIYILRTTQLLADYDTICLHLIKGKNLLRIEKDSGRSQNSLKTDYLTRCQSRSDPPPLCLPSSVSL